MNITTINYTAAATFEEKDHIFVKFDSNGRIVPCEAGDAAIGIIQGSTPSVGESGEVALDGICKVRAGGTITAGDFLTTGASGRAVAGTGAYTGAQALSSGVAGDLIDVRMVGAAGGGAVSLDPFTGNIIPTGPDVSIIGNNTNRIYEIYTSYMESPNINFTKFYDSQAYLGQIGSGENYGYDVTLESYNTTGLLSGLIIQSQKPMLITTGTNGGSSNTSPIKLETGSAGANTSGSITLATGPGATRGAIILDAVDTIPATDNTQNLGSAAKTWNVAFVQELRDTAGSTFIYAPTRSLCRLGGVPVVNVTSIGLEMYNGYTVYNVPNPSTALQVANKQYVDAKFPAVSGSFTTSDGKTITVTNGVVTAIV